MKKFCVLQVTASEPTRKHVDLFGDRDFCDFFFVTYEKEHKDALKFCPNTTWAETRNILAHLVPKNYYYYVMVDNDYKINSMTLKDPAEQIYEDLNLFNPAVLSVYPGKGMHLDNVLRKDDFFKSCEFSTHLFMPYGMKCIHHSLLNYFYPLLVDFDSAFSACHFSNILEIPFFKDCVCTHNLVYDNLVSDRSGLNYQIQRMGDMWEWARRGIKKNNHMGSIRDNKNHMDIKEYFVKKIQIEFNNCIMCEKRKEPIDFLDLDLLLEYFDINH